MGGERYPGIARATLEIALDNGGINRFRSAQKQRKELASFLANQPDGMLQIIDEWLSSLSDERLSLVATGGQDEPETVAAKEGMPPFTEDLLNRYFDEVC